MVTASQPFQVFVKPIGARCNLDCHYCYYLKTQQLYVSTASFRMSDETLEAYITQHIAASPEPVIRFSWHGGEPLLLGLNFFRTIVALQRQHLPPSRRIVNGVQTNGTLLNEEWCRFFAAKGFSVGLSVDGPPELHNRYRVTKNQQPTHAQTMEGYRLLQKYGVYTDILCVVHALNVQFPLPVYRFFKQMQAPF
ncbi:MAG: radical SAM protein, partial [Candidatus Bathyarchaeota archaeon]